MKIPFENDIEKVICLSASYILTTKDKRLFSWGWNEHGNLGSGDKKNRDSPTEIKFLIDENS